MKRTFKVMKASKIIAAEKAGSQKNAKNERGFGEKVWDFISGKRFDKDGKEKKESEWSKIGKRF